jgi:hypothetical protein
MNDYDERLTSIAKGFKKRVEECGEMNSEERVEALNRYVGSYVMSNNLYFAQFGGGAALDEVKVRQDLEKKFSSEEEKV